MSVGSGGLFALKRVSFALRGGNPIGILIGEVIIRRVLSWVLLDFYGGLSCFGHLRRPRKLLFQLEYFGIFRA